MNESNYPPGVSGFEPQIAGYDEREVMCEVYCPVDECSEFSGQVLCTEVSTSRGDHLIYGNRYWTCPACGENNEEFDIVLEDYND